MKGVIGFSDHEVSAVLGVLALTRMSDRNTALFTLGIETGFRIAELLSITLGDVYEDGKIRATLAVARRFMKRQREGREIPLSRCAQASLRAYLPALQDAGYWMGSDFLFQSSRLGNAPLTRSHAWQIIHDAAIAAGITKRVGCHSMRKTFARRYRSWLLDQLAIHKRPIEPMRELQKALGHKSIESTEKYIEWDATILNEYIASR